MERNRFYLVLSLLATMHISLNCEGQDNLENLKKEVPYWHVEKNKDFNYIVIRGGLLDKMDKNIEILVDSLNDSYDEYLPVIKIEEVKNDTIQITLEPEEIYLNQLGSYGWLQYLLKIVFTLTEAEGINYVNLNVGIGEHGKPGIFSREIFEKEKDIAIVY